MKTTADNQIFPDRLYYYLLEWKDQDNNNYFSTTFPTKNGICELTLMELTQLLAHAMCQDMLRIGNQMQDNENKKQQELNNTKTQDNEILKKTTDLAKS